MELENSGRVCDSLNLAVFEEQLGSQAARSVGLVLSQIGDRLDWHVREAQQARRAGPRLRASIVASLFTFTVHTADRLIWGF
ncbi:hypothetical protein AOXY_G30949 [Acipenser oxyrinchus oxyrinchus]|uniref:Uncharacterized protein n=1 Tax=Acipenser oxyrinchus oxyrinchus TaxID=40147 RepID=A0AAD8CJZ7_ACIOX|nr:hypothetical protein AOXY_G30949 [Acipenser oxyrinchus oxyrinchus]